MIPVLEFGECIKDSPAFRELLHQAEFDTSALEILLDKVSKQSSFMTEAGKHYNTALEMLKQVLQEMGKYYEKDNFVKDVINQFLHVLLELNSFHTILDQAQQSINQKMTHFLKSDVKTSHDLRKIFYKASNDYDNALSKYASVSRYKPNEIEESEAALAYQKTAFRRLSMDYAFQINMLHKNKRTYTISQMTSYMHAFRTYFHQGFELFKDVEPFFKKVADQLDDLSAEIELEKNNMITQKERYEAMTGDSRMYVKEIDFSQRMIEGYLFKRASNAFKTWNRRWFTINNNQLLYQGKIKSCHQEDPIVIVDDLRLCTIRLADDIERRFCFEVISPSKSFLLQADSEDMRQAWMQAIQSSIQNAYKSSFDQNKQPEVLTTQANNEDNRSLNVLQSSSSSPQLSREDHAMALSTRSSLYEPPSNQSTLERILHVPGNTHCADCKKPEARWASVNLGIVMCIECSGVHRSLGVHISKVRSLTLDSWEPEGIAIMQSLGNDRVNEIYEARIGSRQIRPGCSNKVRSDFIQAKYVRNEFHALLPNTKNLSSAILGEHVQQWKIGKSIPGCKDDKIKKAKSVVFEDGSSNNRQEAPSKSSDLDGETEDENCDVDDIAHINGNLLFYDAAKLGNLLVMVLAKANGADLNWKNSKEELKTPLMQAALGGSICACEYLLINGAKINDVDALGKTALHYAAVNNNTGIACQFLKRRADHKIKDQDGKTALQIAIDMANADIVTLIRLKQMHDEMLDADPGSALADTLVSDVFKDFSHRAASNDLAFGHHSVASPHLGSSSSDAEVFVNSVIQHDEVIASGQTIEM